MRRGRKCMLSSHHRYLRFSLYSTYVTCCVQEFLQDSEGCMREWVKTVRRENLTGKPQQDLGNI